MNLENPFKHAAKSVKGGSKKIAPLAGQPFCLRVEQPRRYLDRPMTVSRAHFILFVRDQAASTAFFRAVLAQEPTLDVPGMTELVLASGAVLGLMPHAGVVRLLGAAHDPALAEGGPRAELYLMVDDPAAYHARAIAAGATALSPIAPRDWGHEAGYVAAPDGIVVAFARVLPG